MPGFGKVNGTYQEVASAHAKVNGGWQEVAEAHTKVNGVWRKWFELATGIAGYVVNGREGSFKRDYIQKFEFATETASRVSPDFNTGRQNVAGFSDPTVAGYSVGGFISSVTSFVQKFIFATGVISNEPDNLLDVRQNAAGFANPNVAGYTAGGNSTTSTNASRASTVYKHAFPSDTISTTTSLITGRTLLGAMADPGVAGYVGGGAEDSNSSRVERFSFPTDSRSSITSLSSARHTRGFANAGVAGYFVGTGTTIDRYAFPTNSRSTLANGLPNSTGSHATFSNPGKNGYVATGLFTGLDSNSIVRTDFSTETSSVLLETMPNLIHSAAGFHSE